jgi:DNA-binding NarL/FixJ family response regulator
MEVSADPGPVPAERDALAAAGRVEELAELLRLGSELRRQRRWADARRALEQAAAGFEELGEPDWAARARGELERVGGRRPHASGELTPAERRVVELAAAGLSNKQIAGELVVTVNTVEVHLSRSYAKLGVRSRAQLAARLR